MTRQDIAALFPGATDEQITGFLNAFNSGIAAERAKSEKLKGDASKAAEYKRQLDELEAGNMTELEKSNKSRDEAIERVNALEAELHAMKIRNGLAEQGIIGDDAENLLKGLTGGEFDPATLGTIIKAREKAAVSAYEKRQMTETPEAPGAGNPLNPEGDKPADVKIAESLSWGGVSKDAAKAREYYK